MVDRRLSRSEREAIRANAETRGAIPVLLTGASGCPGFITKRVRRRIPQFQPDSRLSQLQPRLHKP